MKLIDADRLRKKIHDLPARLCRTNISKDMTPEDIVAATIRSCRKQLIEMLDAEPATCDTGRIIQELNAVNDDDDVCEKLMAADRKRCKHATGCFDCAIREAISIVETRGIS